jgi:Archaeal adenylate kinase
MIIAIYGLPTSGKNYLIEELKNRFADMKHIGGSEYLNKESKEKFGLPFRELPDEEKDRLRKAYSKDLKEQTDELIVIDCHHAFPNKENVPERVFSDIGCYDKVIYLDTSASTIWERIQNNQNNPKNKIYNHLTQEDIEEWKTMEITELRKECFEKNKDFIIFDEDMPNILRFLEMLVKNEDITDAFKIASIIANTIIQNSKGKKTICLLDCDRTISSNDITDKYLEETRQDPLTLEKLFENGKYSTYQMWKNADTNSKIINYEEACKSASEYVILNTDLIEDMKNIPDAFIVGLTSGLSQSWNMIRDTNSFPDVIIGGSNTSTEKIVVSDMCKGFVSKLLREAGKFVIAVGDSMTDILMLEWADEGFVISEDKKSKSLQKYLKTNETGIRQPKYNKNKFEDVEVVEMICND